MGVAVVTLQGDRHSARVGASLLTQAGMTDWIADSIEEERGGKQVGTNRTRGGVTVEGFRLPLRREECLHNRL